MIHRRFDWISNGIHTYKTIINNSIQQHVQDGVVTTSIQPLTVSHRHKVNHASTQPANQPTSPPHTHPPNHTASQPTNHPTTPPAHQAASRPANHTLSQPCNSRIPTHCAHPPTHRPPTSTHIVQPNMQANGTTGASRRNGGCLCIQYRMCC